MKWREGWLIAHLCTACHGDEVHIGIHGDEGVAGAWYSDGPVDTLASVSIQNSTSDVFHIGPISKGGCDTNETYLFFT